jgi:hypothetical protein
MHTIVFRMGKALGRCAPIRHVFGVRRVFSGRWRLTGESAVIDDMICGTRLDEPRILLD